jgi:hypothetical protein
MQYEGRRRRFVITDSYFEIGNTHEVCQDYALSGKLNDNLYYAIITDGCSQSHKECGEVDLGARVVAYAARDALFQYFNKETELIDNRGNGSHFASMRGTIYQDVLRKIRAVLEKQVRTALFFQPPRDKCFVKARNIIVLYSTKE